MRRNHEVSVARRVHLMAALTLGLYAVLAYKLSRQRSDSYRKVAMHALVWNLVWDGIIGVWGTLSLGVIIALSIAGLSCILLAVFCSLLPLVPVMVNVVISGRVVGRYECSLDYPYPWPKHNCVEGVTEKIQLLLG